MERMLRSRRLGNVREPEVPGVGSMFSRVSPEMGWWMAGQAGLGKELDWESLKPFVQERLKG